MKTDYDFNKPIKGFGFKLMAVVVIVLIALLIVDLSILIINYVQQF